MANTKTTQLPELTVIQNEDWIYVIDKSDLTDSPQGTSKKISKFNLGLNSAELIDNADISSYPTGDVYTIVTEAKTYTDWGGIVVPSNTLAVLIRLDGVFSSSQTSFDLTDYFKKEDLSSNLNSTSTTEALNLAGAKVLNEKVNTINSKLVIETEKLPTGALDTYETPANEASYFGMAYNTVGKLSEMNINIVDNAFNLEIYKINYAAPSGFTLLKTVLAANLTLGVNTILFTNDEELLVNEEIVLRGRYGYGSYNTIPTFSATTSSTSLIGVELGFSLLFSDDKLDDFENRITSLEKQDLTVNIFGDSITENLTQTGAPYDTMLLRKLKESFNINSITNQGHQGHYLCGDDSGGTNSLVQYALATSIFPKLVIVMAGTNDYGLNKPIGTLSDDYTVNNGTTSAGLMEILDHFTNGGSKVLFVTTPQRNGQEANNGLGLNLRKYVNAVKDVCYQSKYYNKVWVLDYWTLCGWFGADETGSNKYYTSDGLHLSYAGYESLTTMEFEFIKTNMKNQL